MYTYIVTAKSDAEYDALRDDAVRTGATVVADMRSVRTLVVTAPDTA